MESPCSWDGITTPSSQCWVLPARKELCKAHLWSLGAWKWVKITPFQWKTSWPLLARVGKQGQWNNYSPIQHLWELPWSFVSSTIKDIVILKQDQNKGHQEDQGAWGQDEYWENWLVSLKEWNLKGSLQLLKERVQRKETQTLGGARDETTASGYGNKGNSD